MVSNDLVAMKRQVRERSWKEFTLRLALVADDERNEEAADEGTVDELGDEGTGECCTDDDDDDGDDMNRSTYDMANETVSRCNSK